MANALNEAAWSTTAATNDGIDSIIGTVANTSSPTSVDDWIKGIMASRARARLDTGGALVAGGTATALTVTSNQVLSSGHIANGLTLKVRTGSASTGAATIAIDGLTAVDIKNNAGGAIASGDWASGAILILVYSSTATAFIAANINPTLATIELGHASDTTLSRSAAGQLAVEAGAGSLYVASIELGHASANTLTVSSGVLSIEGVPVANTTSATHADALLDTLGTEVKGALLYHNGTSWVMLAPP